MSSKRRGPAPSLSEEDEAGICEWVLSQFNNGVSLRQGDVINFCKQYLDEHGLVNPFKNSNPTRSWFRSFVKRHPEIGQKFSQYVVTSIRRSADDSGNCAFASDSDEHSTSLDRIENSDDEMLIDESVDVDTNISTKISDDIFFEMFNEENDPVEFEGFTPEDLLPVKIFIEDNYHEDNWWGNEQDYISKSEAKISTVSNEVNENMLENLLTTPAVVKPLTASSPAVGMAPSGSRLRSASSNPAFKKPFIYGFRREVVYRGFDSSCSRRLADIYYYTPEGKKLRSVKEIAEYLSDRVEDIKLTVGNFTFLKEPIGVNDEDQEIVRDIKDKRPPIKSRLSRQRLFSKSSKGKTKSNVKRRSGEITPRYTEFHPEIQNKDCSPYCPDALGITPTLECKVCTNFYHPQCLGIKTPDSPQNFVCKSCVTEETDLDSSSVSRRLLSSRENISGLTQTQENWPSSKDHYSQQSLVLMNGKKFIVISRHNIVEEGNTIVPPPMSIEGEPQLELVTHAPAQHTSTAVLPKGSILLNQPCGPGTPGGMYVVTPSDDNNTGPMPQPTNDIDLEKRASEKESRILKLPKWSFFDSLSAHQNSLLRTMSYLPVHDLVRASSVCKAWKLIASDASLWKTVRMKQTRINDWDGCFKFLEKHNTKHLDLRQAMLPKREEEVLASWHQFCNILANSELAYTLVRLDLCRCPGTVVASVASYCPNLQLIGATAITAKGDYLDLAKISGLRNLEGLRLKSSHGLTLENFHYLEKLRNLRQLSLTSIRHLPADEIAVALESTTNLELLELGDCTDLLISDVLPNALLGLNKLKRLRLEKLVPDNNFYKNSINDLIYAIAKIPLLTHLELINIEAPNDCDKVIAEMTTLRDLLIVPNYSNHGAKTCQLLLRGVLNLRQLASLTWCITTEIITSSMKLSKFKTPSECIPIITPYSASSCGTESKAKTPEREFLKVFKLKEILQRGLPLTTVNVNKSAFQATWRQTLSDWDLN